MTANIPVIDAGDGPGQHPTQALLYVYSIEREIGKLDGIKVGLGDLANGANSLLTFYLLAKYNNLKIYLVSPEVVKMKRNGGYRVLDDDPRVAYLDKRKLDFTLGVEALTSWMVMRKSASYVFV